MTTYRKEYLYASKQNPVKMQLRRFLFSTQNVLNTINLLSWPTDMPTLLSFPTSMKPWIPKTRSNWPARRTHKVWQRHTEALTGKNISSLVWQYLINTYTQSPEGCLLLVLQEMDAKLCGHSSGVWHCYEWLAQSCFWQNIRPVAHDPTDCLIGHFKL